MNEEVAGWLEQRIEDYVPALLKSIGVTFIPPYGLWVGDNVDYFKLDALGRDDATGEIVVAEFKCKQDIGVIGQLLTYCHVVEETARHLDIAVPVRGIVASTHVEANWVPVAQQLSREGGRRIDVYAIRSDADQPALRLVRAEDAGRLRNKGGITENRRKLIDCLTREFGGASGNS